MKMVGEIVRGLGTIVFFSGMFWTKGPAITIVQYGWGIVTAGSGVVIILIGVRIMRFSRGCKPGDAGG